jgi:hypothetical protein
MRGAGVTAGLPDPALRAGRQPSLKTIGVHPIVPEAAGPHADGRAPELDDREREGRRGPPGVRPEAAIGGASSVLPPGPPPRRGGVG